MSPAIKAPLLPNQEPPSSSEQKHGSFAGAVFNVSTSIVGAGIMSIRAAFKVLGVIPSLSIILIIAWLSTLAGESTTYAGVLKELFWKAGYIAVQIITMVLVTFGSMIIFSIIIGDVLSGNKGVLFEFQTLPVDPRAVADGDGITVYVSSSDPVVSSSVPKEVNVAAVQRAKAREKKDYTKADALHQKIIDSGYRVLNIQNEQVLARKFRIRLRGIDAPESQMPFGKEAQEELLKIVQWKSLKVLVAYGEDQYGRSVGDIYCNGVFVQEAMLKKGLAWHYVAYDKRMVFAKWEKEARQKRIGLWASSHPEKPWDWRKNRRM